MKIANIRGYLKPRIAVGVSASAVAGPISRPAQPSVIGHRHRPHRPIEIISEPEKSLAHEIVTALSANELDTVREHASQLLNINPESTVALEGMAAWASGVGDYALTAKFCTMLVTLAPDNFEAWFNLALAHQMESRWVDAIAGYEEAIRLCPHSTDAYTNLGYVKEKAGDLSGARLAYRQAIRLAPDAIPPAWNMALLLEHSGQIVEAEQWYDSIVEKAPLDTEARFRLGYVRLQREDFRGAADAFIACLKECPDWPDAQANLAVAAVGLGMKDHAVRLYDELLEAHPDCVPALQGLAGLATEASEFDSALHLHQQAIAAGQRSAEVLYSTALFSENSGRLAEAAQLYQQAIEKRTDMSQALVNLGRVLEHSGSPDEARACWMKAVELDPEMARWYFGPPLD